MSRRLFPPVFAPTASHPLVDDFTLRAMRQQSRQPVSIQTQYNLPLRNHPLWSGNNEIGREAAFAPDANNKQTILKMEEWGPPQVWTVALGLNFDPVLFPDTAFSVVAEIQFGVGGVVQTVEVDFLQGSSVTVVANSITVNALYPLNAIAGSSIPSDLILRASLSQGANQNATPTRSYRVLHPATSPIAVVPVPKFAKDAWVGVTGIFAVTPFTFATNAFVSFQHGSDETPTTLAAMSYPASQTFGWIDFANLLVGNPELLPVPEGARSMAVIWAPGGVPANPPGDFTWRAQFRLGI